MVRERPQKGPSPAEERIDRLKILVEISRIISSSLDLDEILRTVAAEMGRLFDFDRLTVSLLDEPKETLTVVSVSPEMRTAVAEGHVLSKKTEDWRAVSRKKPTITGDLDFKGRSAEAGTLLKEGMKSSIVVPLMVGKKAIGALSLHSKRLDSYSEEDLEFLEPVGAQIALAIDNAQLYQAMQQELAERQRAEEALRESEERFRQFFENEPEYCYMISPEGVILDVNNAALKALGYKKEELVGKPLETIYAPESRQGMKQLFAKWKKTGHLEDEEMVVITKEGHRRTVLLSAGAVRDKDGRILHSVSVQKDITERKRAEEALRESEERYRTIFETTGTATVVVEEDTTISVANTEFEKLSGYSKEEIEGKKSWTEFVAEDDLERMKEYHRLRRVDPDAAPRNYEFRFIDRDGNAKEIFLTIAMIPGTKQSVASLLDITERKRAEEEIQRYLQRLEALREIDRAITSTLGLAERLDIILEQLERVIPYTSAAIFLLTDDIAKVEAARGFPDQEQALQVSFSVREDALARQLLEERRPIVLADAQADRRFQAWGGTEYVRSWIGVPLVVRGEVTGFLTIDHKEPDLYDEESGEMALTFANQVAIAIENARLFEESQRYAQRLEEVNRRLLALQEISTEIAGTEELNDALRGVQENVTALFEEVYPLLFALYDEKRQEMEIRGTSPDDPLVVKAKEVAGIELEGYKIPLSWLKRRALEAMRSWTPFVTQDAGDFIRKGIPKPVLRGTQKAMGVKCIAGIPLTARGKYIGAMIVASRVERLSDEDLQVLAACANQAAIAIENARAYERLRAQNLETISALAVAIEAKDPYTGGHSHGVAEVAVAIAEKMNLSTDEIENLRVAALLHDIGKIGIPDSVLHKPAKLTSAERLMINSHPVIAAEIVERIEALTHLVPIIRHHHERYDGQGYPDGLKGKKIPLLARILAVADGFEAMTSERPYRRVLTDQEALAELEKDAGRQWDPKVVEILAKIYEERASKGPG